MGKGLGERLEVRKGRQFEERTKFRCEGEDQSRKGRSREKRLGEAEEGLAGPVSKVKKDGACELCQRRGVDGQRN